MADDEQVLHVFSSCWHNNVQLNRIALKSEGMQLVAVRVEAIRFCFVVGNRELYP